MILEILFIVTVVVSIAIMVLAGPLIELIGRKALHLRSEKR